VKGEVRLGTGDPCTTGYLLGAISIGYGFYGESIKVIPDFENEVYEGQVFAKGRIRTITLLIICIKLIIDSNFRTLLKKFNKFKEEL
jgi:hypothetical protein